MANVWVLKGGLTAWIAGGYPTEPAELLAERGDGSGDGAEPAPARQP